MEKPVWACATLLLTSFTSVSPEFHIDDAALFKINFNPHKDDKS